MTEKNFNMSEKESETSGAPAGNTEEQSLWDERRFLRRVRWRSALRTILIALGVMGVSFALLFIWTRHLLNVQGNRIDSYYPDLVRYSTPNTIAIRGSWQDVGWLGQQREYYLVRMVGNRPVYAGTTRVEYQVWGGEMFWEPDHTVLQVGGREYLLPGAVPRLRFFHPAVTHDQLPRQFDRLKDIPAGKTVEMALSFNRLLTRKEMFALLPRGVEPLWGAISAYSSEEIEKAGRKNPSAAYSLAHRLVGLPLGGFPDGEGAEFRFTEEKFPAELQRLSKIPSYSSQLLGRTADYLQKNGIRYYGLVVCGKPADLLKLQNNPMVSAAVLGAVADME
ncbi:anti-sigma factor [Desulfofundulus thermocisternus]|uniref:anti-sigma factor n=1 Tax=Desulfofundulus thermocisternus TaxID=42471 RepID=UPI0019F150A4|nr:anti-sigma factor [Desulfofundulus thermocisternus]MBE3586106.1 anti-sigma factor [Thermoanaerobacter sp.]MCS5694955.1 anti-sigma factor [Desulfofundulus thermocisternus]